MVNIHQYWVYILSNKTHSVLYIGVTNDLYRRYFEHRNGVIEGFTKKYKTHKLVYFETTTDVSAAITREKQLKLLGDVRSDAQWLNRMVENLLSVTRVDADKVRLSKHSTVLEELIDALLLKFYKHYPHQQVNVQIPEEFVSIPMDPVLIEQVLMNLLENAVFHAHGMTNLWLRVETSGNQAIFTIEDDGCGIPTDRLSRLFSGLQDKGNQMDTGRSNMGIGLSVCRTIVKAHGSDIRLANRPGGGTVFSFTLEMEEAENVE